MDSSETLMARLGCTCSHHVPEEWACFVSGVHMVTIKGTKVFIPDIEVFVNEVEAISIKQEADENYQDEPSIVIVDRRRAEALIVALRGLIDTEAVE